MEHDFETHKDCENYDCPICDGGLALCTVCGLAEGSLTTDCPGQAVDIELEQKVYNGEMDFKNGEWIEKRSPHSPGRK